MTEYSRPFELSVGGYDEVLTREYFKGIMSQDGYIVGLLNELEVYPKTPNDMSVNIKTGGAWVQGGWYSNTAVVNKAITGSDPTLDRVDRIVLRLTVASPNSAIALAVLEGTLMAAGTATPTALTQSAATWEISLAQVLVTHGITSIAGTGTSLITDERDTTYCGVASPLLGHFTRDASGNLVSDGADLNMGGTGQIIGLADPTSAQHAATKASSEAAASTSAEANSSGMRGAVRCATTAAITLASDCSNNSVIDGITLVTGDRVLVKNQTTGTENGIYTANASGAPTRALDFDTAAKALGSFIPVREGTDQSGSIFRCTNTSINWGVTDLTFAAIYTPIARAGDTVLIWRMTIASTVTQTGSYLLVPLSPRLYFPLPGTYRMKFFGLNGVTTTLYAKLYKNGSTPVGTERSWNYTSGYAPDEDITVAAGDYIEIHAYVSSSGGTQMISNWIISVASDSRDIPMPYVAEAH